ncbi:type II toxin-antitoxin system HipA family toxin [Roseateles saccharophilus]|uniref:Serine/threonine-protein kinase HipA n=1 Tax=Roseateles saccharophilus TaxID=304 RepID=A0A4R3UAL5_ROSSA|nr:type II toxin-antitoxin system HipA family toxin [Roseateles saccharophilus]MDG0835835.1 type II toxin-antitoxin system HipA family toxin [Roseateles saccharophilus]TCU83420.1 serine/threonine-protein kinase HipA [Roseateles saccharophilus]
MPLPDRIPMLEVSINGAASGQLLKTSNFEFRYRSIEADQPSVALLMPARVRPTWQDGALFPVMDQNLPEGDLLLRLSLMFPKQRLQPMHLLAMIGQNGIGQLGYQVPGADPVQAQPHIDRQALLSMPFSQELFDDLVHAYLSSGVGIAGVQPKIMLSDRATVPIPSVIVKVASTAYAGLAANEFLCLSAARRAGILTPGFDLSHDGHMLIVDRFDLAPFAAAGPNDAGQATPVNRLGFEDIASLMGLRVRDVLSERKYVGSYQRIADLLRYLQLAGEDLHRFFEQVALSVMVRNGDAHLKNFGVLVPRDGPPRLSPLFDVVTTAVYSYTRFVGDVEQTDRTMALKLFAGKHHTKAYPTTQELLRFGTEVCGVVRPRPVLERIAEAMDATLAGAQSDDRIPASLLALMKPVWQLGMEYAKAA